MKQGKYYISRAGLNGIPTQMLPFVTAQPVSLVTFTAKEYLNLLYAPVKEIMDIYKVGHIFDNSQFNYKNIRRSFYGTDMGCSVDYIDTAFLVEILRFSTENWSNDNYEVGIDLYDTLAKLLRRGFKLHRIPATKVFLDLPQNKSLKSKFSSWQNEVKPMGAASMLDYSVKDIILYDIATDFSSWVEVTLLTRMPLSLLTRLDTDKQRNDLAEINIARDKLSYDNVFSAFKEGLDNILGECGEFAISELYKPSVMKRNDMPIVQVDLFDVSNRALEDSYSRLYDVGKVREIEITDSERSANQISLQNCVKVSRKNINAKIIIEMSGEYLWGTKSIF